MAAYGSGLGHVSRMVRVARSVEKSGCDVVFSTWGEAAAYVASEGFRCLNAPNMDVRWDPVGGFAGVRHIAADLPGMVSSFFKQVSFEMESLRRFGADIVLSDSRLSAVVASHLRGVPSLVVLNQIRLLLPQDDSICSRRFLEDLGGEVVASLWSLSRRILIPDLPPPYTISERNLWGVGNAVRKMRYVGFMVEDLRSSEERLADVQRTLRLDDKPLVFAQISGPEATKVHLLRRILDSEIDSSEYTFVVSAGVPNGSTQPKKYGDKWFYEWCPVRDELFQLASLVVARGGHSTLSQAIRCGKPMVIIPIPHHSEQIQNAEKAARLGVAVVLDQLRIGSSDLGEVIGRLLNEPACLRSVLRIREQAMLYDGIGEVTKQILELTR